MRLLSFFLALALSTSAALAGDVGPLSPGKPAGVKHAQANGNIILWGAVGAAALAGFAVALTGGTNSAQPAASPTTSSIASTS